MVFDPRDEVRKERRAAKAAAASFVRACHSGDVEALNEAVDAINYSFEGWTCTLRKVAKEVREVSANIQSAFLNVWIESRMLPLRVVDHRALCVSARVLLPPYRGPALRLFRGASAKERRSHIYGLSWSADRAAGERFAIGFQDWDGGGVLLETIAPPEAIICAVSEAAGGYYDEKEYVVDRRHLKAVKLVGRYPKDSTSKFDD